MSVQDESTYGFNKQDAESLVSLIGLEESSTPVRMPGGNSGAVRFKFFKLNAAVVTATTITGLVSTYSGTTSGSPVNLVNWEGLLDGAPLDYIGLFAMVDDEWVFVQGPCVS